MSGQLGGSDEVSSGYDADEVALVVDDRGDLGTSLVEVSNGILDEGVARNGVGESFGDGCYRQRPRLVRAHPGPQSRR